MTAYKLYKPPKNSHKGQNGKLLIIGGSKQYHGAPMFSILAARRFVDLVYFYPGEDDSHLVGAIKTIPEAMVVYDLERVRECDCVLFGIGLANAKIRKEMNYLIKNAKRLVIDGDGLRLVRDKIPKGAIITPHEGEFRMLFSKQGSAANVKAMAKKHGCIILKKDPAGDIISDGKKTVVNKTHNPGMTKGGTGDVLAGLVAALACKNDSFTATVAGAKIAGTAGNNLMKRYGYNFCATDLADALAETTKRMKM